MGSLTAVNQSMSYMNEPGIDLDLVEESSIKKRVLVVDDDADTVTLMKAGIAKAGFNVTGALSGYEAIEKVNDMDPHIILLDLMMPEIDGFETYNRIRKFSEVPVIVVSAITGKESIVKSLEIGLDDYVTKPYHLPEIVARVKAVLRRVSRQKVSPKKVFPEQDIVVDFENHQVLYKGTEIKFTPKEFALFSILARSAPKLVTYNDISMEVWNIGADEAMDRIKYLVYLVRKKIGKATGNEKIIVNRSGVGYLLDINLSN